MTPCNDLLHSLYIYNEAKGPLSRAYTTGNADPPRLPQKEETLGKHPALVLTMPVSGTLPLVYQPEDFWLGLHSFLCWGSLKAKLPLFKFQLC